MSKNDYYQVLGVSRDVSPDELKKAYKKLAREHHPDCNQSEKCAEDRFKEISEAYSTLCDSKKRKEYDMFGHGGAGNVPPAESGWSRGPGGPRVYNRPSGPGRGYEDIFGGGGGIGDLFSEIFGGGTRGGPRVEYAGSPFGGGFDVGPRPGRNIEADISVGFDDAIKGGTHKFKMRSQGMCTTCSGSGRNKSGNARPCAVCNGSGRIKAANGGSNFTVVCSACEGAGRVYTDPCPSCRGSGRKSGYETLTVKIPAGVRDGGRLRIPGKGEVGPDGRAGDLYLKIKVAPHKYFRRQGDDLHLDLPVTVSEAALGAKIEVPTLDAKAILKVPAGTKSGAKLRLKGKGAPHPQGKGRGHLYAHVRIEVPKHPDKKTKQLLEELKKHERDPRKGKF